MERGAWWVIVHGVANFLQVGSESDSFLSFLGETPCYRESFPTRLSSCVCVCGGLDRSCTEWFPVRVLKRWCLNTAVLFWNLLFSFSSMSGRFIWVRRVFLFDLEYSTICDLSVAAARGGRPQSLLLQAVSLSILFVHLYTSLSWGLVLRCGISEPVVNFSWFSNIFSPEWLYHSQLQCLKSSLVQFLKYCQSHSRRGGFSWFHLYSLNFWRRFFLC